jgi:alpha-mannosidase
VPSAGYKAFEILDGAGSAPTDNAAAIGATNATLENAHVKVRLDADGAIASLIGKVQSNAELAAVIDGLKLNDFAANETEGSPIVVENAGPVSVSLKCSSEAGLRHTTHVTLIRDSDRVEIQNGITENFADVRHWSFSFSLASPDVHAEEVGTVIRVKKKAAGGDYADSHARYDYITLNHFADITNGANTRGVTLSNADCAFFRLGHSTPSTLDTATPQINVLAGGQVDGPRLGIRKQNGATRFLQRFALRPHSAYDPVAAMKFALEHQNPLVTGAITGTANSPYPAERYSLLTLSAPSVLLWALKPHEDGIANGVVARIWNLSTKTSDCALTFTPPLGAAKLATHIETDQKPLNIDRGKVVTRLARSQLQTLRLLAPP